jgi:hypothetical protein
VYGYIKKLMPDEIPLPRKMMRIAAYKDAILTNDLDTGRAMSGILIFITRRPLNGLKKMWKRIMDLSSWLPEKT